MKFFLLQILLLSSLSFAQDSSLYLFSSRLKFADYLFCNKEYLRSALEYSTIISQFDKPELFEDTLKIKISWAYSSIENYNSSNEALKTLSSNSSLKGLSNQLYFYNSFKDQDYSNVISYNDNDKNILKLKDISYLITDIKFKWDEYNWDGALKSSFKDLYIQKEDITYKSPWLSGVLSAFIPGLGKIYNGEYTDGIFSFLTVGTLGYLSYTNFKHNHDFRGYLFAGLGLGFYGGNIYGSYTGANLVNVKIKYEYIQKVLDFVDANNYFISSGIINCD